MPNYDSVILGINHMFLYPGSVADGDYHTTTLRELAARPEMDALDCWVWASHSKEELAILRNCGKQINYNIGDRVGETPVFPATPDAKERQYSLDILKRETDFALECGAKKIVFASGRDVPEDRCGAQARFAEFVLKWSETLPSDVWLCLEPVDRDIDKFALFGDLQQTCDIVRKIRADGFSNIGILLDMGHIPIMHETIESAIVKSSDLLEHIHLGSCLISDPTSPLYGDKHPCWGHPGGEYDQEDGVQMLRVLKENGYLSRGKAQTISFEMRPLIGMDSLQSLSYLEKWFFAQARS